MLNKEENDKLCLVEGDAPMGQYVRRYWLPFLLSSDLPEPDCEPVRVRLLGEQLVAFRDTSGAPGLIEPHCPHRRADLFYGRNEEGGIRCIYHGWKFSVNGTCLETPTEPKDSNFKLTVRLHSYPVREAAGILWTYMGPSELEPELPDFEFMHVPERFLFASWSTQACNFTQAIEGGIDTMHSVFLHSTLDSHRRLDDWKRNSTLDDGAGSIAQGRYRNRDNPAQLHATDTDFGVIVGGQYPGDQGEDYWRYNLFLLPFYTMPPGRANAKLCHAFVPIDDVTTARWSFSWNLDRPHSTRDLANMRNGSGVHVQLVSGTHTPVRVRANDYLIDREEQRTLTFTGIKGTGEQDFAVQEGMGAIVDRSRERLGVSDGGIVRMRQRLLKEVDDLLEGAEPYAPTHPGVYRVHAGDALLPGQTINWADEPRAKAAMAAKW
ncbi:MAG TPA: Rieske 2Fe-2S domain-containing protein [Chloroflexota bacterium]|nr:Rieske 2Fe-2S domain-containing protein [Chloroflexota bacterium]